MAAPLTVAAVTVRFDPASPEVGPFPTDALTVEDPAQKTGRRINLPLPDCGIEASACEERRVVNEYDGFSLTPRIRVRFSGPVNPDTLRGGIFFAAADVMTKDGSDLVPAGKLIRITQVIYDPETNTAYAKPEETLEQGSRYVLLVTNAVRDRAGEPVLPDGEFPRCLAQPSSAYCEQLGALVPLPGSHCEEGAPVGPPLQPPVQRIASDQVAGAALFTTLSATAWLEQARDLLSVASLDVRPASPKSVFAVVDLATLVFRRQTGTNPASLEEAPVSPLRLEGVGRIAFGSYRSPNFLPARPVIAATPSGGTLALPTETSEIFFNATLPASAQPDTGYPVVIYGIGWTGNRFSTLTNGIASSLAAGGYATVTINPPGHGFGPEGRLILSEKSGPWTELPAGGRGVDVNGDGMLEAAEGCATWATSAARAVSIPGPFGFRDCFRQTVVDLMQLVRAIRAGIDLNGDGVVDLDPNRIYYAGLSLGAMYGTILSAVEPNISAAVLNGGGGSGIGLLRWGAFRPLLGAALAARTPPVAPNRGEEFDENYVLRGQPAKVNDVPGAIEIQNIYEMLEWIQMPADPLAYAPHLCASPLPNVPAKRVLFQNARGDQRVPNPLSSALIRAAGMRNWSVLYRHDLARAALPGLARDPHTFLIDFSSPAAMALALAAQQQAVQFLATGERCKPDEPCVPDANGGVRDVFGPGADLFEVPEILPEDLGFLAP